MKMQHRKQCLGILPSTHCKHAYGDDAGAQAVEEHQKQGVFEHFLLTPTAWNGSTMIRSCADQCTDHRKF